MLVPGNPRRQDVGQWVVKRKVVYLREIIIIVLIKEQFAPRVPFEETVSID